MDVVLYNVSVMAGVMIHDADVVEPEVLEVVEAVPQLDDALMIDVDVGINSVE